jgi:hypothetical protein
MLWPQDCTVFAKIKKKGAAFGVKGKYLQYQKESANAALRTENL